MDLCIYGCWAGATLLDVIGSYFWFIPITSGYVWRCSELQGGSILSPHILEVLQDTTGSHFWFVPVISGSILRYGEHVQQHHASEQICPWQDCIRETYEEAAHDFQRAGRKLHVNFAAPYQPYPQFSLSADFSICRGPGMDLLQIVGACWMDYICNILYSTIIYDNVWIRQYIIVHPVTRLG